MKVFFIAYNEFYKVYPNVLEKIKAKAEALGHTFSSSNSILEKNKDHVDFYNELQRAKKEADLIIADIGYNSTGIGHEVSWAISNRKPTLLIYSSERAKYVSNLLINKSKAERLLESIEYADDESAAKHLEEFSKKAKNYLDTKFILIISPEIDRYLEWAADFKRMHKAQIVRTAVEEEMEKDEDYQKYMKEK